MYNFTYNTPPPKKNWISQSGKKAKYLPMCHTFTTISTFSYTLNIEQAVESCYNSLQLLQECPFPMKWVTVPFSDKTQATNSI